MIGIRSITYNLPFTFSDLHFNVIQKCNIAWKNAYPLIRTFRANLSPIVEAQSPSVYRELSAACSSMGIRWFNVSLDPSNSAGRRKLFNSAKNILEEYNNAFVHVLGIQNGTFDNEILRFSAKLIQEVSTINSNGQDNFRLGISTNVKPNGPFFPFTMSSGDFGFSIALELTQEINRLILNNANLNLVVLREVIIDTIRPQLKTINDIANEISEQYGIEFYGFDFSLAPIIEENGSVISILRHLGVENFGAVGSMFATSYLTNLLKSFGNKFKMVGFSGVMYSLIEDFELCSINNSQGVSIETLVSLSTMCGCGLDMVPVYGKISVEEIMAILYEIGAISTRLNKPLGARILPIPRTTNGVANQYTMFYDDADFIANTKVVEIRTNQSKYHNKTQFSYLHI